MCFSGVHFQSVEFLFSQKSTLQSSFWSLIHAQFSLLDPMMLRLYFIKLCVLLLLAVFVAPMQVPPLAGNSRAYLAAVQLLQERFSRVLSADDGVMVQRLLHLLNDPEWSAVDANRLTVHVGCSESSWHWPVVVPYVSDALVDRLWPSTFDLLQDPQQFHIQGNTLHSQYPDIPDEVLRQSLVLDYPQPGTGLTLIQRALRDQDGILTERLLAAGSIVDLQSSKEITELLKVQHLPLSPSLEPILPFIESERGDPFVLMGDDRSTEPNLNSPEDLFEYQGLSLSPSLEAVLPMPSIETELDDPFVFVEDGGRLGSAWARRSLDFNLIPEERLDNQHLIPLSPSLEAILPSIETELDDPFNFMEDGGTTEKSSNLNLQEDLLKMFEEYVNEVANVEHMQLGKYQTTND
jgi:hypothetical protein